jgi:hypothetical protein
MSYTGVGVPVIHDPQPLGGTGRVAAKDILRRDHLDRTVVTVPKAQPIPAGMALQPARQPTPKRPPDRCGSNSPAVGRRSTSAAGNDAPPTCNASTAWPGYAHEPRHLTGGDNDMSDHADHRFDAAMRSLQRLEAKARADATGEPQAQPEQRATEDRPLLLPPRWQLRIKA